MKSNSYWQSISLGRKRNDLFYLLGWAMIMSISLYFIYTNALRYLDVSNPVYTPERKSFTPFFVIHIAFGMIALLIGPLQFFSSIRKKYPRTHRIIGRIYITAIVVSGMTATYLAIVDNLLIKKEFVFGTGVLGLALCWFVTVGMAFWAIKERNFLQHQEWMIRSYVVTYGFTTFRLIFYNVLAFESFPFKQEVGGVTAWACWAFPLLATEVILQAKKIHASAKKVKVRQMA